MPYNALTATNFPEKSFSLKMEWKFSRRTPFSLTLTDNILCQEAYASNVKKRDINGEIAHINQGAIITEEAAATAKVAAAAAEVVPKIKKRNHIGEPKVAKETIELITNVEAEAVPKTKKLAG